MNDCHPHELEYSHSREGISEALCASYSDQFLPVVGYGSAQGVLPIELKRFLQSISKGIQQLPVSTLLAIHAGDFFNPSDPPIPILFCNGCICVWHVYILGHTLPLVPPIINILFRRTFLTS